MVTATADLMRKDRDRFVGFAFAAADLLVELDTACCIKWAGGAARSVLGVDYAQLGGLPSSSFLPPPDDILLKSADGQSNSMKSSN